MNRQRDIDRTLEAWFLDGPSVMPDRVFDAVFDQVGRTPQRRLARLHLRLTEMNPRLRLVTVLAAALLVVVATLALLGGGSNGPVKATPNPEPSPDAGVPAALLATWLGEPSGITGFDADAGVTLAFTAPGSFWMTQSNFSDQHRMTAAVVASGEKSVELTTGDEVTDCNTGAAGTYTWSLSTSGQTLTLAAENDACPQRLGAMPGAYWRMDCPTADDNCLGPVDAGTYGSQFIDPFLTPGATWTPRYGALTYTVPAGWVNRADWPGDYSLAPDGAPDTTAITVVSDVVAASRADNCTDTQDPDAGTTAEAIVAALPRPGVTVSTPEPVTIGGLSGFVVDLALDDAWSTACPWSEGRPFVLIVADRPTAEGFSAGLDGPMRMRTFFLDVAPDRAIMVAIETATEAEHAAFLAAANAVVDTFQFTP